MSSSHLDFCVLLLQACCLFAPVASHHFPVVTRAVCSGERETPQWTSVWTLIRPRLGPRSLLFQQWFISFQKSRNRVSSYEPDEGSKTSHDFRRFESVAIPLSLSAFLLPRPPPKQLTACCEGVRSRLVREHVPGRGRVDLAPWRPLHRSYRAREQRDFTGRCWGALHCTSFPSPWRAAGCATELGMLPAHAPCFR